MRAKGPGNTPVKVPTKIEKTAAPASVIRQRGSEKAFITTLSSSQPLVGKGIIKESRAKPWWKC